MYVAATRDTIIMTEKMAKIGAQVVLVVTPCYYKNGMTNTALINHFTKVWRFYYEHAHLNTLGVSLVLYQCLF